jgi:predicted dehydrogenase
MILLIGYGYWGKNLARNFNKELVAICDQDDSKLALAKNLYQNINLYSDINEALKQLGPEFLE